VRHPRQSHAKRRSFGRSGLHLDVPPVRDEVAFLLVADDLVTGDHVEALIMTKADKYSGLGGSIWPRAARDGDLVWFFAVVIPRRARASGGYEALVEAIGEVADAEAAWVMKPCGKLGDEADADIRRVFRDRGGFVGETTEALHGLLVRRPRRSADATLDGITFG